MAGTANIEARRSSNMDGFVLMEPYADKSGTAIAAKGDALSEDVIGKLADAGIMEVALAPATPTEIACAQLCGLGHFRMRGYVNVESPEDFQKWYNDQEAALQAASQPADSASAGAAPASPDSTSTQQETGH